MNEPITAALVPVQPAEPDATQPAEVKGFGFDYKSVRIKDIELEADVTANIDQTVKTILGDGFIPVHGGKAVTAVIIDGERFTPTGRFWESLYSRFGLSKAFFKFFSHNEVFNRISGSGVNDKIRVAIERNKDTGDNRLLAATGLNKPVVIYDDLLDILKTFQTEKGGVRYHNGTVMSTHIPRIGQSQFKIGADKFSNRYELHCPIDGYGSPDVFLALLRQVCSNGAVAFAPAFKTTLALGSGHDDTRFAISRALDSFTNDEGYAQLRTKFDLAAHSWASINEHQELYNVILKLQNDPVLRATIGNWSKASINDLEISPGNALMKAYDRYLGDPYKIYNNAPNLMGNKRRRALPMPCTVYDMFNFATELATHHVSEAGARQLQLWVGSMLTTDYDLEETCDQFADFRDLFLANLAAKAPTV